jgi:hypothetical protein
MRKPVILTGRRLTPEESGRLYGLSKRHTKQIIDMVEKSLAKRSYSLLYYDTSSANKNGDVKVNTRGRKTRKAKSSTAPRSKSKRAKAKTSH